MRVSSSRLRRWISESGVSRGTRTSERPSLSATSAARSTRFELKPAATRASVPMLQGHRITAPVRAVPEEGGASTMSGANTRTDAAASPSQPSR